VGDVNKGDLVDININGQKMTVCIVGFYVDDDSGEEVALLVVVPPESLLHVPVDNLAGALESGRWWN